MQDLSSPPRDRTHVPCFVQSPNHPTTRKVPVCLIMAILVAVKCCLIVFFFFLIRLNGTLSYATNKQITESQNENVILC